MLGDSVPHHPTKKYPKHPGIKERFVPQAGSDLALLNDKSVYGIAPVGRMPAENLEYQVSHALFVFCGMELL